MDLPNGLKGGEKARLFPIVAETSKEKRVISTIFSMLPQVPELSKRLFSGMGVRLGSRAKIECYTEVVLDGMDNRHQRPDALIIVSTGQREWRALVEAKIGNTKLDVEQVTRYVDMAKANGIDAVITISNEFSAQVDHHPSVKLTKHQSNKVTLFHWPWMLIQTQAKLVLIEEAVDDTEQLFLLDEVVRFMEHPSTGIEKFNQMPVQWKDVVATVRDNGKLNKSAADVVSVVSAWNQEVRDLSLTLSSHIGSRVEIKLSNAEKQSAEGWLNNGCAKIAKDNVLSCSYKIPDTASDLDIQVDISKRTVTCCIRLAAPKDKVSSSARVNWLVRQLKGCESKEIQIRAIRPGAASNTQKSLDELRENPKLIEHTHPDTAPTQFDVFLTRDMAGNFNKSKKFIDELEEVVQIFYDNAVQYLTPWQAPPPKPVVRRDEVDEDLSQPIELSE